MSEEPVLRPEEIAGVLSGTPDDPTLDAGSPADSGPQVYSLKEPVAIPASAERTARQTLERIAAALGAVLRAEADAGIELTVDGLQQQRTEAALSVLPPPAWVVSLARPGGGGLALALHPAVALALVDLALGGQGRPGESGREPTELENRVLSRLIGSAAEPIAGVLGESVRAATLDVGAVPSNVATGGETVGVGLLRFKIGEEDHASLLLVTAALLLPSRSPSAGEPRPPGPLASRLERVALDVRPVLRAGRVGMRDLVELERGKVLRLDAAEDTLFDLRVADHNVIRGRIVRQDERSVFAIPRGPDDPSRKEP